MKKSLFYIFMALVCAACTLDGCRKNDGNESKGPNVEGVFWFEEEEPAPGVMMVLYLKDGNMSYYPWVHIRSSKMKTAHPEP